MAAISAKGSMQKLLALVFAVALMVAPSHAYCAEATAAASHHQTMTIEAGHYSELPSEALDHEKLPAKNCCVSMCQAIAVAPVSGLLGDTTERAPPAFATPAAREGYLGEIATPPPRKARASTNSIEPRRQQR